MPPVSERQFCFSTRSHSSDQLLRLVAADYRDGDPTRVHFTRSRTISDHVGDAPGDDELCTVENLGDLHRAQTFLVLVLLLPYGDEKGSFGAPLHDRPEIIRSEIALSEI